MKAPGLIALLALTSCGSQIGRLNMATIGDCGTPSLMKFHGVHPIAVDPDPLPPEIIGVADGCAMLSFSLDADGKPIDVTILMEHPPGKGIGDVAVQVLGRDRYAANSEVGFDTMAPTGADTRYALSMGFGHPDGRFVISRRTVPHHQTIRLGH